jgi:hypothetical protein
LSPLKNGTEPGLSLFFGFLPQRCIKNFLDVTRSGRFPSEIRYFSSEMAKSRRGFIDGATKRKQGDDAGRCQINLR